MFALAGSVDGGARCYISNKHPERVDTDIPRTSGRCVNGWGSWNAFDVYKINYYGKFFRQILIFVGTGVQFGNDDEIVLL